MPKGNTKFTAVDPAMAGRSVKALLRDSKNNLSQRVKTRLNNTREQRTKRRSAIECHDISRKLCTKPRLLK